MGCGDAGPEAQERGEPGGMAEGGVAFLSRQAAKSGALEGPIQTQKRQRPPCGKEVEEETVWMAPVLAAGSTSRHFPPRGAIAAEFRCGDVMKQEKTATGGLTRIEERAGEAKAPETGRGCQPESLGAAGPCLRRCWRVQAVRDEPNTHHEEGQQSPWNKWGLQAHLS